MKHTTTETAIEMRQTEQATEFASAPTQRLRNERPTDIGMIPAEVPDCVDDLIRAADIIIGSTELDETIKTIFNGDEESLATRQRGATAATSYYQVKKITLD